MNTLSAEHEAFLRARGWSPDMDADQREAIESYWTPWDIEMALALGFS